MNEEIDDIKSKISNVNKEIKELNEEIKKYTKMNKVINNEVLVKLYGAKKYLQDSYNQIRKGYSSAVANKKIQKLKNQIDETNIIINQIKGKILSESNKQIKALETKKKKQEQNKKGLNAKLLQIQNYF